MIFKFHICHLPPITRSMACSKCFWLMASERWRAAISAASLHTLAMSAPVREKSVSSEAHFSAHKQLLKTKCIKSLHMPEKPGVRAAIFLARFSLFKSTSSFSGLRWTLNIEALPLISGGPAVIMQYIKYALPFENLSLFKERNNFIHQECIQLIKSDSRDIYNYII